ncbi:hypothetical protein F8388_010454 [Cannabis sativa]|uniref:23 kDa subunit of oxygen evolving system of photosystem II n=1 Tax=Cannabis sativa TaxID=3483 RepID=A0A7J6GT09_CANSA|nr:hypothetical protein F8388_010454 [Cannabis sativa]KAF4397365.1 hypothetical protein G4B88_027105 [Cannabis sativa]
MASTSCFLHHHALTTAAASARSSSSSSQRQCNIRAPAQLVCRAQKQGTSNDDDSSVVSRRLALTVLIGAAALGSKVSPADAAYGETANIFGKPKTNTDFLPYSGDGFKGGFDSDAVATANILESSAPVIGGKQYYNLSVLTRTADGDEGGKHQLITATIKDGKLYICKAQAGDKRWFKGARKFVEDAAGSFSVA